MIAALLAAAGLVFVGLVVAGGAAAVSKRSSGLALPSPPPSTHRDGMNLRVRDIVTHLDRDYLVIGKITFEEAGRRWYAYRLQDGVRLRWLRASRGDAVELVLVDELDGMSVSAHPPEEITHGLVPYRLSAHGTARAVHSGSTGWEVVPRAAWFAYAGPGDHRLFVERWAATSCAYAGREVAPYELDYLPGDLVEADDG